MITHSKLILPVCITGAAAIGMAAIFLLGTNWQWQPETKPATSSQPAQTIEAQVIRDIMEQTTRRSKDGAKAPVPVAPPFPSSLPTITANTDASRPPIPPPGYSFVSHGGDMRRAPMESPLEFELKENPSWMHAANNAQQIIRQANHMGRDWTFVAARVAPNQDIHHIETALHRLGAMLVLDEGEFLHVKVPASMESLESMRALPGVLGLGAIPSKEKLPSGFMDESLAHPPGMMQPVIIRVMGDGTYDQWRADLTKLGLIVGDHDPALHTYVANMPYGALRTLSQSDFVLSVEPAKLIHTATAEAVSVMGADGVRSYDASNGRFIGLTGKGVAVGILDSGLNVEHLRIHTGRESICGVNFVENEDWDLWLDTDGHGTAITGLLAGAPAPDPVGSGMAPGVSHIRFGKVGRINGFSGVWDAVRGMLFFMTPFGCDYAGQSSESLKPLIVNASLGGTAGNREGFGARARALDFAAHSAGQLYVTALGNFNHRVVRQQATAFSGAKNSFSVGEISKNGYVNLFSVQGPTWDGRLVPNLVAVGGSIATIKGRKHRYRQSGAASGTSLSTAVMSGVATLLLEADPKFRNNPALVRARLMASAIRPEAFLQGGDAFRRDNTNGPGPLQNYYGLGIASARTSLLNRDTEDGWVLGSATSQPLSGDYEYIDVDVPEGASRLDVVMTWDEQPAGALSQVVINDLDLWVDAGADCGEGPCGERSSESDIDSVEWVFISNPKPGIHRIKIVPKRLYGEAVNAAVAWKIVHGDPTPQLALEVSRKKFDAGHNEYWDFELSVRAESFVAAGTILQIGCRSTNLNCGGFRRYESTFTQADGLDRELTQTQHVVVGELAEGEIRRVMMRFYPTRHRGGDYQMYFSASAANAQPDLVVMNVMTAQDPYPDHFAPAHAPLSFAQNDNFSDAMELSGSTGETPVDLNLATREPGEIFNARVDRTLWYRWSAPASGRYRFQLLDSESRMPFEGHIALLRGEELLDLELYAHEYDGEIQHNGEVGASFYLRVSPSYPLDGFPDLILTWERVEASVKGEEKQIIGGAPTPTTFVDVDVGNKHSAALLALAPPENDNFDDAQIIAGAVGSVVGDNRAATIESGEFIRYNAKSVWYKWTAPDSGYWKFNLPYVSGQRNDRQITAYSGDALSELRLVSDPDIGRSALFPAEAGQSYRLSVGSHAYYQSTKFTIEWFPIDPAEHAVASNDMFANAQQLNGIEGAVEFNQFYRNTIEPREPLEAQLGSRWWRWSPPKTGSYSWRIQVVDADFQFDIFRGKHLEELTVVASRSASGLANFHAEAGATYYVCVSDVPESIPYRLWRTTNVTFEWSMSPENDQRTAASKITGLGGSAAANLEFASAEVAEPSNVLGEQSLWWQWRPDSDGWHRFWVENDPPSAILSIHHADGVGGVLERPISTSERSFLASGRVEAFVLAEANQPYHIRLAERPALPRLESYTLRWDKPPSPPAQLRYRGTLNNASFPAFAENEPLRRIDQLTISRDGLHVFGSSAFGLLHFSRDPVTNGLSLISAIDKNEAGLGVASRNSRIIWNNRFSRLYSFHNLKYPVSLTLSPNRQSMKVMGNVVVNTIPWAPSSVAGDSVTDSSENYIYHVSPSGLVLRVLRMESDHEITEIQSFHSYSNKSRELIPGVEVTESFGHGLRDIVLSSDGSSLYAATLNSLLAFSRNLDDGTLMLKSVIKVPGFLTNYGMSVSIDAHDRFLFLVGEYNPHVAVLDIETDPENPKLLDSLHYMDGYHFRSEEAQAYSVDLAPYMLLEPDIFWWGNNHCELALPHGELPAVDVFCGRSYYVARWDEAEDRLFISDWGRSGYPGRWHIDLPDLDVNYTDLRRSTTAVSPDGHHIYLAGGIREPVRTMSKDGDEVFLFQRAGGMKVGEE